MFILPFAEILICAFFHNEVDSRKVVIKEFFEVTKKVALWPVSPRVIVYDELVFLWIIWSRFVRRPTRNSSAG
jgi:hypothetical protein